MSDIYEEELTKKGVKTKNIAMATGYLLVLGGIYMGALWSFCYFIRPTENIINRLPYPRLKEYFAKANEKAEKFKFLKKLPIDKRGPFSVSICETLVMKGLFGPIAFPLKLWFAIKLTNITNSYLTRK